MVEERAEVELDVTPLLTWAAATRPHCGDPICGTGQSEAGGHGRDEQKPDEETEQAYPGLVTVLPASLIDLFCKYPIQMGDREREAYDHCERCLFRV